MLQALPLEERRRSEALGERVDLAAGTVLFWPDEPIRYVYFPTDGVVSLLTLVGGGVTVEAGVVGREGMIGLPVFFGADATHSRAVVQVAGSAWRVPAAALRETSGQAGPLRDRLLRYAQTLFQQVAQSSGCHRIHPVEERCARWLLMLHDRLTVDTFGLTQELLSDMLGVRRPSVTVVMGTLQRSGLVGYHRGRVVILDRPGLEAASCECYGVIRAETERLLGPVFDRPPGPPGAQAPPDGLSPPRLAGARTPDGTAPARGAGPRSGA